ncbi:hypothetical protein P3W45_000477 [Vairimorpha bombi]
MFAFITEFKMMCLLSGAVNAAKYIIRYAISFFYNPKIWEGLEGKCVVVTGATQEIGREICKQLSNKKVKILMIDDNRHKLEYLKNKLLPKVDIEYYVVDMNINSDNYNIFSFLEEYDIGMLINASITVDRGMESFINRRDDKIINTNILSTTHITHRVVAQMVEKRFGFVVFIADTAFGLPFPYCSVYSATLAYLHQLASSLYYEMRNYNVVVEYVRHGNILYSEYGKNDQNYTLEKYIGVSFLIRDYE